MHRLPQVSVISHNSCDDGKTHPDNWVNEEVFDEAFNEEFKKVTNDPRVAEADETFTSDVFDDTYLNMELALPRGGGKGKVEFA